MDSSISPSKSTTSPLIIKLNFSSPINIVNNAESNNLTSFPLLSSEAKPVIKRLNFTEDESAEKVDTSPSKQESESQESSSKKHSLAQTACASLEAKKKRQSLATHLSKLSDFKLDSVHGGDKSILHHRTQPPLSMQPSNLTSDDMLDVGYGRGGLDTPLSSKTARSPLNFQLPKDSNTVGEEEPAKKKLKLSSCLKDEIIKDNDMSLLVSQNTISSNLNQELNKNKSEISESKNSLLVLKTDNFIKIKPEDLKSVSNLSFLTTKLKKTNTISDSKNPLVVQTEKLSPRKIIKVNPMFFKLLSQASHSSSNLKKETSVGDIKVKEVIDSEKILDTVHPSENEIKLNFDEFSKSVTPAIKVSSNIEKVHENDSKCPKLKSSTSPEQNEYQSINTIKVNSSELVKSVSQTFKFSSNLKKDFMKDKSKIIKPKHKIVILKTDNIIKLKSSSQIDDSKIAMSIKCFEAKACVLKTKDEHKLKECKTNSDKLVRPVCPVSSLSLKKNIICDFKSSKPKDEQFSKDEVKKKSKIFKCVVSPPNLPSNLKTEEGIEVSKLKEFSIVEPTDNLLSKDISKKIILDSPQPNIISKSSLIVQSDSSFNDNINKESPQLNIPSKSSLVVHSDSSFNDNNIKIKPELPELYASLHLKPKCPMTLAAQKLLKVVKENKSSKLELNNQNDLVIDSKQSEINCTHLSEMSSKHVDFTKTFVEDPHSNKQNELKNSFDEHNMDDSKVEIAKIISELTSKIKVELSDSTENVNSNEKVVDNCKLESVKLAYSHHGTNSEDTSDFQMDISNGNEEQAMEFDILDEFESNENDPEEMDSSNESEISTDEIDAMLEASLGEYGKQNGLNSEYRHEEKEKVILKTHGKDHFEVLPEGWIEVTHNSGMPIYLHKQSRVCCVSKPYFLGPGSTRKHEIPISAIPCLHYIKQKEKEIEEAQKANVFLEENVNSKFDEVSENTTIDSETKNQAPKNESNLLESKTEISEKKSESTTLSEVSISDKASNLILPSAKLESVKEIKISGSLDYLAVREYCKKRFEFQTIKVKRFKTWFGRRKHQKQLKRKQRPFLPDNTQLITCPLPPATDKSAATGNISKREFIMNPTGKSPICILHEYVQHTLRVQPKYIFKELESASTPYGAVVIINGMEYGTGYGSSKKVAKSDAAKSALEVLIPKIKTFTPEGQNDEYELQDVEFFDQVRIEDPRVCELSIKAGQPYPYQILLECLKRNYGMGDTEVVQIMKNLKHQKNEFIMTVGKHRASIVCKNKRDGKHRASQSILQQMHPHINSWGSLLRMYGKGSCKTLKEKKEEQQRITELQSKACVNKPNLSILNKLKDEMMKYREKMKSKKPIGKLIPEKMQLFAVSDSNLKNIEL